MKVTSVSFKKIFPIAQFINQTIGVEVSVDEGEDAGDALDFAKETVESWHMASQIADEAKKRNGLTAEEYRVLTTPVHLEVKPWQPPFKDVSGEINRNDEKIEIAIDNANTIEELGALRANLPVSLNSMYMKKLNELTNKIK